MSRKRPAVLLDRDTSRVTHGIPAATLERSDRADKQMLGGYIARVAHAQFCALADEFHRSNVDLQVDHQHVLVRLFYGQGRQG
jgi:hypothetical protein